ncbi:MAG TPA: hypothetical protein VGN97_05330 [Mesorhizobium sp.]|nr:hypothetical protein [Mesorhizobium sp.]
MLRSAMTAPGTIGWLIDHRHSLSLTCEDCGHHATLDPAALAAKLGRDHSYLAPDLLPRMKCSQCGTKHLALSVSGAQPGQDGLNAYAKSKGV